MKLTDIHFHDSVVYRVTESTEENSLSFEVDYPIDWDKGIYERKVIKFMDVLDYEVHEGPFVGPPTFLEWSIVGVDNGREVVRLETNAGYRQLAFKEVELSNGT